MEKIEKELKFKITDPSLIIKNLLDNGAVILNQSKNGQTNFCLIVENCWVKYRVFSKREAECNKVKLPYQIIKIYTCFKKSI